MRRKLLGFSLVELVISLALVAILIALAAPSLRELVLNNRQATDYNKMLTSLTLARAEAIKRGVDTVVCISDGATPPDCDGTATQWENGWIVFADGNQVGASDRRLDDPADTDGDGIWDPGEDQLLQANAALADGTRLTGNGTNVRRRIRFNARGFSGNTGTLKLCDRRGDTAVQGIVINNTGRPRRAIDSDGDGTVEDGSGNNLTCP